METWLNNNVKKFCYLGDNNLLSATLGWELVVNTHVKTAWKKFREQLPVLASHHLFYKTQGHVYCELMHAECHASC